ncbi:hypothetical protein AMR41_23660 [Hapalosiphon sp. MRB220]|nr:hypothetical protein AMR41_23660 [Hapalosiphon sp. MRB220]
MAQKFRRFPFFLISVDPQYGHCTVDDLNSSLYYATPIFVIPFNTLLHLSATWYQYCFDWLTLNRDLFASYKASLGYIWA